MKKQDIDCVRAASERLSPPPCGPCGEGEGVARSNGDSATPHPDPLPQGGRKCARYYVGVGTRRGVDAQDVVDLVKKVAAQHGVDLEDLALCSHESKADEAGLHEAARQLGVPLVFLSAAAMRERTSAAPTHSPRVKALFGVGSVAEAAALVGAGPGSRLIARRVTTRVAACAIARRAD